VTAGEAVGEADIRSSTSSSLALRFRLDILSLPKPSVGGVSMSWDWRRYDAAGRGVPEREGDGRGVPSRWGANRGFDEMTEFIALRQ